MSETMIRARPASGSPSDVARPGVPDWLAGQTAGLTTVHAARRECAAPAQDASKEILQFLGRMPGQAILPGGNALLVVAQASDRWGGHAYHSTYHHAEVAVNALVLSQMARLLPGEHSILALAAMGHDYRYEPNIFAPAFFQELLSAGDVIALSRRRPSADIEALLPFPLSRGMLSETGENVVRTLILSTAPHLRNAMHDGIDAWRAGLSGAVPADQLHTCERTFALATILCDADLMCSAGLSPNLAARNSQQLAEELKREPFTPDEQLFFLESLMGRGFISKPGQMFTANLESLRDEARAGTLRQRPPEGRMESPGVSM